MAELKRGSSPRAQHMHVDRRTTWVCSETGCRRLTASIFRRGQQLAADRGRLRDVDRPPQVPGSGERHIHGTAAAVEGLLGPTWAGRWVYLRAHLFFFVFHVRTCILLSDRILRTRTYVYQLHKSYAHMFSLHACMHGMGWICMHAMHGLRMCGLGRSMDACMHA